MTLTSSPKPEPGTVTLDVYADRGEVVLVMNDGDGGSADVRLSPSVALGFARGLQQCVANALSWDQERAIREALEDTDR